MPVVAYGGPDVDPEDPSPESVKLNESLVLVEFFGDLYPDSGILPKDPVKRAKARLFIDSVSNKYAPAEWNVVMNGHNPEVVVQALEHLQSLLPPEGFVVGEFSLADIAIAPFLLRLEFFAKNDMGGYPEGQDYGKRLLEAVRVPKLERLHKYWQDVASYPSVASTFDKVSEISV